MRGLLEAAVDEKNSKNIFVDWQLSTPCPEKKGTNSILGITSSNTGRFSKFFKCHNLQKICNKTVIKLTTTPQTHRYTTL